MPVASVLGIDYLLTPFYIAAILALVVGGIIMQIWKR